MPRFNPYRRFIGAFLPNCILRLEDISQGAKLAWGRLAQYAGEDGEAYPSLKTLGEEIGVKEDQARRYVEELNAAGLVEREDRPGKTPRYWHLDDHPCFGTPGIYATPGRKAVRGSMDATPPLAYMPPEENQEEIHVRDSPLPPASRGSEHEPNILLWIDQQSTKITGKGFHTTSARAKRELQKRDSPGLRSAILQMLEEAPQGRNVASLITGLVGTQLTRGRRASPEPWLTGHAWQGYDRPKPPSRMEVALMHLRNMKPLPSNLKPKRGPDNA